MNKRCSIGAFITRHTLRCRQLVLQLQKPEVAGWTHPGTDSRAFHMSSRRRRRRPMHRRQSCHSKAWRTMQWPGGRRNQTMARCIEAAESPAVDDRHTAGADGDRHTDAAGTASAHGSLHPARHPPCAQPLPLQPPPLHCIPLARQHQIKYASHCPTAAQRVRRQQVRAERSGSGGDLQRLRRLPCRKTRQAKSKPSCDESGVGGGKAVQHAMHSPAIMSCFRASS